MTSTYFLCGLESPLRSMCEAAGKKGGQCKCNPYRKSFPCGTQLGVGMTWSLIVTAVKMKTWLQCIETNRIIILGFVRVLICPAEQSKKGILNPEHMELFLSPLWGKKSLIKVNEEYINWTKIYILKKEKKYFFKEKNLQEIIIKWKQEEIKMTIDF